MRKKFCIVICILLFIYFIGGIVFSILKYNKEEKKVNKVKDTVTIKGYDYILYDDDLKIYKEEFKKLKKNLESSNINYLEYANSISEMFIIDLYSLNEKNNMYDIGGVQFVFPDAVDNYKLNVMNTLYKYMEDNTNNDRKQELPTVKSVKITKSEDTKYSIGEKEYDGYKINIDIDYVKDLEYDKSAEIILVKEDKYLYIVEKN